MSVTLLSHKSEALEGRGSEEMLRVESCVSVEVHKLGDVSVSERVCEPEDTTAPEGLGELGVACTPEEAAGIEEEAAGTPEGVAWAEEGVAGAEEGVA